jgi:hypothetical protein
VCFAWPEYRPTAAAWQSAAGLVCRRIEVESYETPDMAVLGKRIPGYRGLPLPMMDAR